MLLIGLPLFAAGMLGIFSGILVPMRKLPPHEYTQAVRAPAWFTVVIGVALVCLSILTLRQLPDSGDQIFIGTNGHPWLMVDAYTIWCSLLLGIVLAVTSWLPAARRSLVPRSLPPFALTLVVAGCLQFMLCSVQLRLIAWSWAAALLGVTALWIWLFRPARRWAAYEVPIVLLLAGMLGVIGLLWLNGLAHGEATTTVWSTLVSAPPRAVSGSTLLVLLAWLGPACYLPWWLWNRREEQAMVWLPAALSLAVVGVLTLTRLIYFSFPVIDTGSVQLLGLEHLFFVKRLFGWVLGWGALALFVGAGWLAYPVVLRREMHTGILRPLTLVISGMLLIGLGVGYQNQYVSAVIGVLWLQFAWVGLLCVWLTAGGLLPALQTTERPERLTLGVSLSLALISIAVIPPTPGYRSFAVFAAPLYRFGLPAVLVILAMVIAAVSTGLLLPRWYHSQASPIRREGVGWGIIGPFALTLALLVCGLLAGQLTPLFKLIAQSLLQAL
ncbi:MAG TPA: hypothetical protein VGM23_06965 [Armatimonadota bacterium]|jgi:hypothetical protein